jgi:uncharacterized protein YbjQ (UPF0145 family)
MSAPAQPQMPVTTAVEVPGTRIGQNLGVAFGLVVRSVGIAKGITGGFRSLRQGEVTEYTEVLEDARRHAIDRMLENARLLNANAVVAMRFDSAEMGRHRCLRNRGRDRTRSDTNRTCGAGWLHEATLN